MDFNLGTRQPGAAMLGLTCHLGCPTDRGPLWTGEGEFHKGPPALGSGSGDASTCFRQTSNLPVKWNYECPTGAKIKANVL